MVASCVQVVIGATGIVGILLNLIGPLTVTSVISLVGLSLHQAAATKAGKHWGIGILYVDWLNRQFTHFLSQLEQHF